MLADGAGTRGAPAHESGRSTRWGNSRLKLSSARRDAEAMDELARQKEEERKARKGKRVRVAARVPLCTPPPRLCSASATHLT